MMHMTKITVRGYHVDMYQHVNNARYLEFLEEARWDLFEGHVDLERWKTLGLAFFVANLSINYRRPASLGDVLEIATGLSRFGHKSATFSQRIVLKGTDTLVADADITFVLADMKTGRAVPIEGELRALFEPFCLDPSC